MALDIFKQNNHKPDKRIVKYYRLLINKIATKKFKPKTTDRARIVSSLLSIMALIFFIAVIKTSF